MTWGQIREETVKYKVRKKKKKKRDILVIKLSNVAFSRLKIEIYFENKKRLLKYSTVGLVKLFFKEIYL